MNKSLGIFLILCSFIFPTAVNAQQDCNLVLRGKIVHAENNEPIESAFILLVEQGLTTTSDHQGNFRLQKICPGPQTIKIQYLGHQTFLEKIDIKSSVNMTFRLVAEDIEMEGVDIHGHQDALLTSNTVSSIYGELLKENRGLNLAETLKKLPGLNSYASGSTIQKPVIHGLHSNRILILNNGVRLEGQQWGAEHAPEIDPFIANEIAVVKGAETVRFGPDAMGGVILVNPAALPVKAEENTTMDLIGFSNGRGINAAVSYTKGSEKIKGLGYRLQASTKAAGNVSTPNYLLNNTGMREYNFSSALGYSNSRLGTEVYFSHFQSNIGILRDSHTGNLNDLENIIANGRPFTEAGFTYSIENPRQTVDHQLLKLKAHYHLGPHYKLNLQYAFQRNNRQEFDRRRGERNDRASLDMVLFTNTLDLSLNHQRNKNWDGVIGISAIQQANSNIPGTGVTPLIPNFDMVNLGIYAIEKLTKGPLEIEGGIRYDYRWVETARFIRSELQQAEFTFNNLSASLGGTYALTRSVTFNSNLGTAWRPPNVNEQFSQGLHHGLAAIEIGNPDFVSEQAYKWLNTVQVHTGKFSMELTAYLNRINNYIYIAPTENRFVSVRGTFNVFEYQQADADFSGLDFSGSYELGNSLELFSRASLVRAKNRTNGSYFPFIPADRMENGFTYRFGSKHPSKISISYLAVARQNREPEFDLAPAPEAYGIWNISGQTNLKIFGQNLKTTVQVNNLFNQEYRDYMNRFRYFSHELGKNVLLKLNYEF